MRLSDILDQASDDNSPCVVYQNSSSSSGLDQGASAILSYAAAAWVMKKHEQFLDHKIKLERQQHKPVVVAFLADNSADLLLATLACTHLPNALPVLLNTRWTPVEIAQALQSQNPDDYTIIVHDKNHTQKALQASGILRENHKNVSTWELVNISSPFQTKASNYNRAHNPIISVENHHHNNMNVDNDTALILFTSGTTSGSKGVLLSHRALIIQAQAKLNDPCYYDATTKMLATTVPLFHVGGLSSALAVWMAGGSLVFPPPPTKQQQTTSSGFQPQKVLQSLSQGPQMSSNTLVVVPAMLSAMMDSLHQQREKSRSKIICFPEVKLILIGGQSATTPLLKLVVQHFPNARMVQTYACTEGASSLTFWERKPQNNTDESSTHHNNQPNHKYQVSSTSIKASHTMEPAIAGDCVGRPPPHIQLELFKPAKTVDEYANKMPLSEPYATGIIATRGPHLFTGYWRRGGPGDEKSSTTQLGSIHAHDSPVTSDGWFLTNDLGYRDEKGNFYFTGRVADVIRTGGETVLASEVERILLQHNDIVECAVFALPDDKFGETVCAAVVSQQSSKAQRQSMAATSMELKNLRRFCADLGLAGYKQPRLLFWVPQLPRNSSGKLLKRVLVEEFRNYPKLAERADANARLLRSKL